MAEITAAMVKKLREDTGLGMMECKKALTEFNGDFEAATDALRAKGVAMAEKKAGRATKEGLVAIETTADSATMTEIVCETDFCSRNDEFKALVADVVKMATEAPAGDIPADEKITARVQDTLAKIGENMSYTRGVKISASNIGSYLHHNNKVGVVVGVEGDVDEQTLTDLCMHIAFADPMGITTDDVPADIVAKEKKIALQQAMESGKPEEIAEKMVEGKMRKFLASKALIEQPFIRDDKKQVKEILGSATVTAFARFAVGEGQAETEEE